MRQAASFFKDWKGAAGVGSRRGKKRLKTRLRIRLKLNFDSMTCLDYLSLDFFQYRKSHADCQAVFQAVLFPSGSDPSVNRRIKLGKSLQELLLQLIEHTYTVRHQLIP